MFSRCCVGDFVEGNLQEFVTQKSAVIKTIAVLNFFS